MDVGVQNSNAIDAQSLSRGLMPIVVNLDVVMARRKMRLMDLAAAIGVTPQNLSILKTGKARAIRFSTLQAVCRELKCQPGGILEFRPDPGEIP